MKRVSVYGVVACIVLGAGAAWAQVDTGEVGVAWDPEGRACNLNIEPGQEGTLYVLAYPRGIFAGGITASEFRVDDFPADWVIVSVTPNPEANLTLGNPLGPGCNIAFPSCQTGTSGVVVLYTIRFVALSIVTQGVLSVGGHTTPSIPLLPCPRLILCDGPADYFGCSQGGSATINYYERYCITAVEQKSWSAVRTLYR